MKQQILNRIVHAIREGNATFMFGAGISMFRRSGCPGWQAMVTEIINEVSGDGVTNPLEYIRPHLGLLFNETFFQIMYRTLSPAQTFNVVRACLDAPHANHIHRFIAWAANHFDARILTSNFDELIERSGLRSKRQIVKLHGTLTDPHTLRFTANQVFAPLAAPLAHASRRFLDGRTLVVAGYGGWDIHDIMPALFQQESPAREIIWIHFPGTPPDERVRKFFTGNTTVVSADVDRVFLKAYRRLARDVVFRDDNLERWGREHEQCDDRDWWIRNVAAWAAEVRANNVDHMRLLWARLADHLRLYEINIDGVKRNLADEAYESIKWLPEPALRYEARSRAAYMGRTMGRSRDAARDLYRIIDNLRQEIAAASVPETSADLRGLLGWCLHQRGVALQGDGRFHDADAQLSEAVKFRCRLNDANLWFSEFQRYMNGRLALEKGVVVGRNFHDPRWQRSFASRLDTAARHFHDAYHIDNYAQTLHNAAFVYQKLAEDVRREGQRYDVVERYTSHALERYHTAASIRMSLRDPRMIAQSKLRLAQVEVLRAANQVDSPAPLDERLSETAAAIARARIYANEVKEIYAGLPQEEFRVTQVDNVIADGNTILSCQLNSDLRDWLPQNRVVRVADFDRTACELRRARDWHLGVITAVFDRPLRRVLLVHLGSYASDPSGQSPWVLPGGAVEPYELPSHAAARELLEETDLRIDRRRLRPAGWFPRPDFQPRDRRCKGELLLLFVFRLTGRLPMLRPRLPEITEARFMDVNVGDMLTPATHEQLGGPLPHRHVYWSRLAQAAVRRKLRAPRVFIYRHDTASAKPWLNLEKLMFEVESFFN